MSIYTKTGDGGTSSVIDGKRQHKDSAIFDALGSLDELNALLGYIHKCRVKEVKSVVIPIQSDLFEIGAYIAGSALSRELLEKRTKYFESIIDEYSEILPKLDKFILPGGTETSTRLHHARAVCRRVERNVVRFISSVPREENDIVLSYLNRLSDLLFVLARYSNYKNGVADHTWDGRN